jgi:hypothetical protein
MGKGTLGALAGATTSGPAAALGIAMRDIMERPRNTTIPKPRNASVPANASRENFIAMAMRLLRPSHEGPNKHPFSMKSNGL